MSLASSPSASWISHGVTYAVALQNLEAIRVLLGCGYLRAGFLVLAGAMAEAWVERTVLGAVGLEGAVVVENGWGMGDLVRFAGLGAVGAN